MRTLLEDVTTTTTLTYKEAMIIFDGCLAFTIAVLNFGLIVFVLCGRKVLHSSEAIAVSLFSATHIPIAFIVVPLRILGKIFPANVSLESCSIIVTVTWAFNDITILSAIFFCFYEISYNNLDSGGFLSVENYRRISFILLFLLGLISLIMSSYLFSYFSKNINENCELKPSIIVTILFELTVLLTPGVLVLVHYFNNESKPHSTGFMTSMKLFSFRKESGNTVNSVYKASLYRRLFSPRLNASHSLHSNSITDTDKELDSIKVDPDKNSSNLNNLSKKSLHFDINTFKAKLTPDRDFKPSPSIVGKIVLIYFIFWTPYFVCLFVVLISYATLYDHTFWTNRLSDINSIAVPIVLRLYINTVRNHLSILELSPPQKILI